MHAVNATLLSQKPLWVIDYSKDLGEKISGNLHLKQPKNGGALGLPYIPKEKILAEKTKYLNMLKPQISNSEPIVETAYQGTLF